MVHGRLSLNLALLLLQLNFLSGFRLELMYMFVIYNIKSQLSTWLSSAFAASKAHRITFYVCTNRITELFNMCLKESSFLDFWKVSSVVPAFENTGESSTTKNYHTVSLLFVVNEVSEKLVSNRLVNHLEICGLFLNFQYGFRSFDQLQIFILTVLSDRIARAFNRSQVTKAVAFDISKAFDRIWHAVIFTSLSLMEL